MPVKKEREKEKGSMEMESVKNRMCEMRLQMPKEEN